MSQFFVVLPSNSSTSIYPNNKLSNFKVNLPRPIELDPTKWEVALSEIQFPHSWYNIREGNNMITKEIIQPSIEELNVLFPVSDERDFKEENEKRKDVMKEQPSGSTISYRTELIIPPGHYVNVQQIIKKLEEADNSKIRPIQFLYNEQSNSTVIWLQDKCKLNFNHGSDIAYCLGFDVNKTIESDAGPIKAKSTSTIQKYNTIYCYTDIIKNQFAGDYNIPLLRVISTQSQYGDYVCKNYDRPHFLPLSRRHVQEVEIDLRDDTGEPISFEAGKVIVTLVFRRKQAKFYT